MSLEILTKLNSSRKELLDLGLRNPLLNYRTRVKKIDVVDELSKEVLRILIDDRKTMSFSPIPEKYLGEEGELLGNLFRNVDEDWKSIFSENDEELTENMLASRHTDTKLQTKLSSTSLHSKLLAMHNNARTYIEEQGVNILYLALGFLHWYESEHSDNIRKAPIILVPVELKRSSARERFRLSYTDEELGTNLSLQEKLKNDFAMKFPAFHDDDNFNIDAYFDQIEDKISLYSRWEVKRNEIILGFFSFGKFLMYKDLDSNDWPEEKNPASHPIMKALLGEGFRDVTQIIPDDSNIDQLVSPQDVNHVMDADSTQVIAIQEVKNGNNMVIQGPPGTGKSQTITNIIAEALGTGKKVLFVSEKMAALEVVKRRLDNIGLGDTALELHSHKTNKKRVLEELDRTLRLGKPLKEQSARDIQALINVRNRLNSYCDAVNAPILNTQITPVEAIGHYIKLGKDVTHFPENTFNLMKDWSDGDFKENRLRIEELQRRLKVIGIPSMHPFWGVKKKVLLPSDEQNIQSMIIDLISSTNKLIQQSLKLANLMNLEEPLNRSEVEKICYASEIVRDAPDIKGMLLHRKEWLLKENEIDCLLEAGKRLTELHEQYDQYFIDDAWNQDLIKERQYYSTYGEKWWRIFSKKYRQAKSLLKGFMKESLPKKPNMCLELIDAILEEQKEREIFIEFQSMGSELFGLKWKGEESDWNRLFILSEWTSKLHEELQNERIPEGVIGFLENIEEKPDTNSLKENVLKLIEDQQEKMDTLMSELDFREEDLNDSNKIAQDLDLTEQLDRYNKWIDNFDRLKSMIDYNILADEFYEIGLEFVLPFAERWDRASEEIVRRFDVTWYRGLLENAFSERQELQRFNREGHEFAIETFRNLDQILLEHNRIILAARHWSNLPNLSYGGELSVIKREINKKRRHLAIRKLIKKSGRAIQTIKPVFMMSPMSIAKYLPQGCVEFDLVVFDEASQVKPVDSFGAILRGKQTVVVGDNKQLPPTSFFDALVKVDDDDFEDDFVTGDMQCILSLFLAQNSHERMLNWHYRSRHDSLIAVSNNEFYNNKLVTFPCSRQSPISRGLIFHHLPETYYGRGKTRTNPIEARKVAEAIMAHASENPKLTLGVAAFNAPQRDAIIYQLELLRKQDFSCEDFFNSHHHEPFFIKNLENVQGDERDVILISVGFGKSEEGAFSMGFGPLNNEGGERRLNVLISRARHTCRVFANFTAEDIDLRRTKARGVVALKNFLAYAKDRTLDIAHRTTGEPESPFEEEVIKALEDIGYQVEPQVGSAGFRVDIGIIDENKPGRYLLGIECDGAMYHSAQSARDRDRLRQEVLKGLGWSLHRIWSTDWFHNPKKELERAVEAIEKSKIKLDKNNTGDISEHKEKKVDCTNVKRTDLTKQDGTPIEVEAYQKENIEISLGMNELHSLSLSRLAKYIEEIVDIEGPVHKEIIIKRIANGAGLKRAGNRIRNVLGRAITYAVDKGLVKDGGDNFIWGIYQDNPPFRNRSNVESSEKKLELIAKEEIAFAFEKVVSEAFSISHKDAVINTLNLLGFKRITISNRTRAEEVLNECISANKIVRLYGDFLSVIKEKPLKE